MRCIESPGGVLDVLGSAPNCACSAAAWADQILLAVAEHHPLIGPHPAQRERQDDAQ